MQFLVIVGVTLLLAVFAYWFGNTYFRAKISQGLMADAVPYEKLGDDPSMTLLVLGDSTGVGVGAEKPEDSVAGRLARYLGATYVENRSVIGAAVADLAEQKKGAALPRYDVILVMIGGNDILAFGDAGEAGELLGEELGSLSAGKILVMTAGNVGGATLFPPFVRPFHTATNLKFHKEFAKAAAAHGALYVNLYEPFWKDPFLRNPYRYLSRDGLHPSTYGYGLWFDKLRAALEADKAGH